jgi:hypothetical protein
MYTPGKKIGCKARQACLDAWTRTRKVTVHAKKRLHCKEKCAMNSHHICM